MAENVADLRARALADLAEAERAELPHIRLRSLRSAESWTKMADLRERLNAGR